MGISPKRIGVLFGALLIGIPVSGALADSLQLLGAGPAGTVNLYGTALPSPYNDTDGSKQVDVYAGVLDWKNTVTNASVYTYCIDVGAIIQTGHTYTFNGLQPLGSVSLGFSTAEIDGIYKLWTDTRFGTATGVSGPLTSATPQDAAMFQVAIWDILYNNGSTSLTNTALSFSGPGNGLDSTHLLAALSYANDDYTHGTSSNPGVDAFVATDGSQNQALYISGGGHQSPAPLPASFTAGAGLLVLLGTAGLCRRAANQKRAEAARP